MKKFISIFIILVVSVSLFLVSVSADTVDDFTIALDYYVQQNPSLTVPIRLTRTIENKDSYFFEDGPVTGAVMDYATQLKFSASVVNSTSSVILKENENFSISISGIYLEVGVSNSGFVWKQLPDDMYIHLQHSDGTITQISNLVYSYSDYTGTSSITASGVASKDVYRIVFYQEIEQYTVTKMHGVYPVSLGMGDTVVPTYIKVEIESKEAGMLGDISNELDNIANGTVEPDKSPADDKVNDVGQQEDQLLQDTAQGREDIVQYITQAIAELSAYATAFVALNAIVDGFFYLPIIGPLIIISLSLGIFALIVNLAQTATRSDKSSKPKGKGRSS